MGIDVNEREAVAYLGRYTRGVQDRREKTRIIAAGGQKVKQAAAKAPTPKSRRAHYYYPAKGGRIEIKSGNLQKSMKVYRTKGGDIEVGPRVIRKVSGVFTTLGATAATSSGFYAAALYGSVDAFRRAVMEPALIRSQTAALTAMQKRYERLHKSLTR